jgi:hypothetical protein
VRPTFLSRLAATVAVVALLAAAGCASAAPGVGAQAAPGASSVGAAGIYVPVLRRYLGTPSENSFPDRTFDKIFVFDRAVPGIGSMAVA